MPLGRHHEDRRRELALEGKSFPKELPSEAGATHIGMFFAWTVLNGLISNGLEEDLKEELESLLNGEITPSEFVWRFLDGKLSEHDLNAEGRRFAEAHYNGKHGYLGAYERIGQAGGRSEYYMADSWSTYRAVGPLVDSRYQAWLEGFSQTSSKTGQ